MSHGAASTDCKLCVRRGGGTAHLAGTDVATCITPGGLRWLVVPSAHSAALPPRRGRVVTSLDERRHLVWLDLLAELLVFASDGIPVSSSLRMVMVLAI